jgi:hypothetical protein
MGASPQRSAPGRRSSPWPSVAVQPAHAAEEAVSPRPQPVPRPRQPARGLAHHPLRPPPPRPRGRRQQRLHRTGQGSTGAGSHRRTRRTPDLPPCPAACAPPLEPSALRADSTASEVASRYTHRSSGNHPWLTPHRGQRRRRSGRSTPPKYRWYQPRASAHCLAPTGGRLPSEWVVAFAGIRNMASSRKPVGPLPPLCQKTKGRPAGFSDLADPTGRPKRPALCRRRIYSTTLETGIDLQDAKPTTARYRPVQ